MTTGLNPIAASEAVVGAYRRYLGSLLPLQDTDLAGALREKLDGHHVLANGPLLEMTPPFVHGVSLERLESEGVLSPGIRRFFSAALPGNRPLYRHQEDAIRKSAMGRNLVVATGTGSGKTESFLVPILDHLARESAAGTLGPGVRALLLYPMNALANDQLKRLRQLLAATPEVTFGRYTGDTPPKQRDAVARYRSQHGGAEPLTNELVSREQMQATPPHILLTNYAMLEYLLLRPRDIALFGGEHAGRWRFVVVDEAHVYDGIKGAEIAMLLRRLRDRVDHGADLQFFASSATVGQDPRSVAKFGESLFDAPFEWADDDAMRRDVVTATRRRKAEGPEWGPLERQELRELAAAADPSEWLTERGLGSLGDESSMRELQRRLTKGPMPLSKAAVDVFPDAPASQRAAAIVDLVNAGHRVVDETGSPLLSARYHLFVSAVEGAFVCFKAGQPHVELARHEECPTCDGPMFEIGACKRCGQLHAVGTLEKSGGVERLKPKRRSAGATHWVVIGEHTTPTDEDDETILEAVNEDHGLSATMCMACGAFGSEDAERCSGCGASSVRRVQRIDGGDDLTVCRACGGRGSRQIRRFVSGSDASGAVIASALYEQLPTDPSVDSPGEGRRLLMFSDSRQQAAFAAPYLERTYGALLQRALLTRALVQASGDEMASKDVAQSTRVIADRAGVFATETTAFERRSEVSLWLHRELIEGAERTSIEGSGLVSIALVRRDIPAPRPLLDLGLSAEEVWDLLDELVQTLRVQGAVAPVEDNTDLKDERLAPRNRAVYVRGEGSDSRAGVLSWVPSGAARRNRRVDYVERVLRALGVKTDARELLSHVWRFLVAPGGNVNWLREESVNRLGIVYRIDPQSLRWALLEVGTPAWRCTVCRRMAVRNVRSVCPTNGCDGSLVGERIERDPADHYTRTYLAGTQVPLRAEEHTAQLANDDASDLQEKFLRGVVNVLSCSTTFEMGVDVGELQSVLLRNVPPTTANYVQRAGRAGRRSDSAALVVTFAQMRSHDQAMFVRPEAMISGRMRAPVVVDDNARVDRRHAHSVLLAAFFREQFVRHGFEYRTVSDFFGGSDSTGEAALREYLTSPPEDMVTSVRTVLPSSVAAEIGVDGGSWLEALGSLVADAATEYRDEVDHFRAELEGAKNANQFKMAGSVQAVLRTLEGRPLIAFLSKRNILPKYGFPVDTVELRVDPQAAARANGLDLSRDLILAINEYAPGNAIVARGMVIESAGVHRLPRKDLVRKNYAVCRACEDIQVAVEPLDSTCKCGEPRTGTPRKFITPEFGFLASRTVKPVGSSRPPMRWTGRQYLLDTGEVTATQSADTLLGNVGLQLSVRATMLVVNEGVNGSRFWICDWCGFGIRGTEKVAKGDHENPRTGKPCGGHSSLLALAHDFQTDVLVLDVSGQQTAAQARSLLYGLLAGACDVLEIARDDVDGTLLASEGNALVLFDAVPGGAGLVKRIAEELPRVVEAMRARINNCECGLETSCHRCLRVYRNQPFHEELSRAAALNALVPSATQAANQQTLDFEDGLSPHALPAEAVALRMLMDAGVPAPVLGHESAGGIPMPISWPRARVVLAEGLDVADVVDLRAEGWTVSEGSPADLASLLAGSVDG